MMYYNINSIISQDIQPGDVVSQRPQLHQQHLVDVWWSKQKVCESLQGNANYIQKY